ncbi:MAG: hypothetical protein FWC15_01500 [Fibromonadales bacterium]|nr:hypothetical protein [Fibromonadales bacterium]
MKKFLFLLSLIFIFANSAFAQTKKKATAAKAPATKSEVPAKKSEVSTAKSAPKGAVPKLNAKEPSFAGFTGSFIKFGPVSGNDRSFTMSVEYAPWFFEIKGTANANYLTPDLGDDVIAVLAYYNALGKTADGADYQAGLFDLMIYLDDEPVKISNLSFALTGQAAAGSSVLAQAKTWNFSQGQVFRMAKYESPILTAQATYLDKSHIERENAAAKKRVADSIAREKKRVSDSIAKEEKRVKDSISAHRKAVRDSIEREEAAAKRASVATKKKKKRAEVDDDFDDEEERPPRQKKKRKPVIEEDDEDEDPMPVAKKKKRRK